MLSSALLVHHEAVSKSIILAEGALVGIVNLHILWIHFGGKLVLWHESIHRDKWVSHDHYLHQINFVLADSDDHDGINRLWNILEVQVFEECYSEREAQQESSRILRGKENQNLIRRKTKSVFKRPSIDEDENGHQRWRENPQKE